MNSSSFNIYDASAGSGKTYSIVKEYLKVLFLSKESEPYRHILAITFTNKAVGEMKDRVISALREFADKDILIHPSTMFTELCNLLDVDAEYLHNRAKILLKKILHNYSSFEISTIDKFTQRLIRSFAYELHLPVNFEVELETEQVLAEAVENLISKAGVDNLLTETLIDFAISKADEDKSWDITYDLNEIAKLLTNENHLSHVQNLKKRSLNDFKKLKQSIIKQKLQAEKDIIEISTAVLNLIDECGLEFSDFKSSYLPKFFLKLRNKDYNVRFDLKWQDDLGHNSIYPSRVSVDVANTIDAIQPQLADALSAVKHNVFQLRFLNNFYKNVTPLSVLNAINNELQRIKEERNLLLISEFNAIVSNHIKQQPAIYIYERIGEKFKHYFIDEFQDTSIMQWENLIPLIGNALAGEHATAMLVGDAKQAIYRWRGGKAEQFIELSNNKNPFHLKSDTKTLGNNYRSLKEIVMFNNNFFCFLSSVTFTNPEYQKLYANCNQDIIKQDFEGYVNLNFLTIDNDDRDEAYSKNTLETINKCLDNGYDPEDICVLVRKKKEGVAITEYLTENSNIKVVSSETLLLSNSKKVQFIINLLILVIEPQNKEVKIDVLSFLATHFLAKDRHLFYKERLDLDISSFFKSFEQFDVFFDHLQIHPLNIYQAIEDIIYHFKLTESSNAYLQYFLDFVLEYSEKKSTSISGFLDHYSKHHERLSIVSPSNIDAVKVMTIHKAKGLEFPIVIFPYANLNIYEVKNPKAWLPIAPENFCGFDEAFLSLNKDLSEYSDLGEEIYNTHRGELELDNINLLYVALTRAVEKLYIISELEYKANDLSVKENQYSGLFINFLKQINKWNDNIHSYSFGIDKKFITNVNKAIKKAKEGKLLITPISDLNISIYSGSGALWDTSQKEAMEKGNLIHLVMSKIHSEQDIPFAINELLQSDIISRLQANELTTIAKNIVTHSMLKTFFDPIHLSYNERDIILDDGNIIRPDRVIFLPDNKAVIIDYKTGSFSNEHKHQLNSYEKAVSKLGLSVTSKILVYINDSIEVKEV